MNQVDSKTSSRWYVLRVWFEHDGPHLVWRASMRLNDQRLYFASPDALLTYLSREVVPEEQRK